MKISLQTKFFSYICTNETFCLKSVLKIKNCPTKKKNVLLTNAFSNKGID
jgi:hypothetical protein